MNSLTAVPVTGSVGAFLIAYSRKIDNMQSNAFLISLYSVDSDLKFLTRSVLENFTPDN